MTKKKPTVVIGAAREYRTPITPDDIELPLKVEHELAANLDLVLRAEKRGRKVQATKARKQRAKGGRVAAKKKRAANVERDEVIRKEAVRLRKLGKSPHSITGLIKRSIENRQLRLSNGQEIDKPTHHQTIKNIIRGIFD
jgi:hypothetical protein